MSSPVLGNVRLIAILAASLLAGYAGDEAYNAWWRPAHERADLGALGGNPGQPLLEDAEPAKVALAPQPSRGN
jgi:hypothetical protein